MLTLIFHCNTTLRDKVSGVAFSSSGAGTNAAGSFHHSVSGMPWNHRSQTTHAQFGELRIQTLQSWQWQSSTLWKKHGKAVHKEPSDSRATRIFAIWCFLHLILYNDICLAIWYSLACAWRARGAVKEDAIADLKPEASTWPLPGRATHTSPIHGMLTMTFAMKVHWEETLRDSYQSVPNKGHRSSISSKNKTTHQKKNLLQLLELSFEHFSKMRKVVKKRMCHCLCPNVDGSRRAPLHSCQPRLLPTFASKRSNLLGRGSPKKAWGCGLTQFSQQQNQGQ